MSKVATSELNQKLDLILSNQGILAKKLADVEERIVVLASKSSGNERLIESLSNKLIEMAMVNQGRAEVAVASKRLTPASNDGLSGEEPVDEETDWFNVP